MNNNYRVAGFWARLLAYALDLVCIYIISSIAVSIISSISKIPQNYLVWMKKIPLCWEQLDLHILQL